MQGLAKWSFLAGLVAAVAAAFIVGQEGGPGGNLLHAGIPWVVGGLGILCGFLKWKEGDSRALLLAATGLVVGLSAILLQNFNPQWLNDVVYFARVLVAHILLSVGLLSVIGAIWE